MLIFSSFIVTSVWAYGNVVINEVEQNPEGNDNYTSVIEWIELYNPTASPIDISGWKISTTQGEIHTLTIPQVTILAAKDYYIIESGSQWLDNTQESVILKNDAGTIIDQTPQLSDEDNNSFSWQRYPNGEESWEFRSSTKSISNGGSTPLNLTLNPGWNMISFPALPDDPSFSSVFSEVSFYQVLTWDGTSYTSPTTAEAGVGYWVLVLEETTISIVDYNPVTSYTKSLPAGWSMIGSIYEETVEADDVFPGFYQLLTWDGTSYVTATIIEPGKGYWALVLESTTITLGG